MCSRENLGSLLKNFVNKIPSRLDGPYFIDNNIDIKNICPLPINAHRSVHVISSLYFLLHYRYAPKNDLFTWASESQLSSTSKNNNQVFFHNIILFIHWAISTSKKTSTETCVWRILGGLVKMGGIWHEINNNILM